MDIEKTANFWRVVSPSEWAQPPSWMSYTNLIEIESCPRRWALINAEYPNIWSSHGYPPVPVLSALEGSIYHLSLHEIINTLVKNGCKSPSDEIAVLSLRQLGGFSEVIKKSLEQVLTRFQDNPRAQPMFEYIRNYFTKRVPDLRTRIQSVLSRIDIENHNLGSYEAGFKRVNETRMALHYGTYTEVLLQVTELRWRGIADYLTLSATQCIIKDFKSGIPKEEHNNQMLFYALLWYRDNDRNPTARIASKLILSYSDRDIELPVPEVISLGSIENDICKRTISAIQEIQSDSPKALASFNNCWHCMVRHLCEVYWQWLKTQDFNNGTLNVKYADIQIRITSQHGSRSWDGILETGPLMESGTTVLFQTENLKFDLNTNQHLRLLNVRINVTCEESNSDVEIPIIIATMGTQSEVFLLSNENY